MISRKGFVIKIIEQKYSHFSLYAYFVILNVYFVYILFSANISIWKVVHEYFFRNKNVYILEKFNNYNDAGT